MKDKIITQKIQLTSQLDEKAKHTVYYIIKGMLTKNKRQTFFAQDILNK